MVVALAARVASSSSGGADALLKPAVSEASVVVSERCLAPAPARVPPGVADAADDTDDTSGDGDVECESAVVEIEAAPGDGEPLACVRMPPRGDETSETSALGASELDLDDDADADADADKSSGDDPMPVSTPSPTPEEEPMPRAGDNVPAKDAPRDEASRLDEDDEDDDDEKAKTGRCCCVGGTSDMAGTAEDAIAAEAGRRAGEAAGETTSESAGEADVDENCETDDEADRNRADDENEEDADGSDERTRCGGAVCDERDEVELDENMWWWCG